MSYKTFQNTDKIFHRYNYHSHHNNHSQQQSILKQRVFEVRYCLISVLNCTYILIKKIQKDYTVNCHPNHSVKSHLTAHTIGYSDIAPVFFWTGDKFYHYTFQDLALIALVRSFIDTSSVLNILDNLNYRLLS